MSGWRSSADKVFQDHWPATMKLLKLMRSVIFLIKLLCMYVCMYVCRQAGCLSEVRVRYMCRCQPTAAFKDQSWRPVILSHWSDMEPWVHGVHVNVTFKEYSAFNINSFLNLFGRVEAGLYFSEWCQKAESWRSVAWHSVKHNYGCES